MNERDGGEGGGGGVFYGTKSFSIIKKTHSAQK